MHNTSASFDYGASLADSCRLLDKVNGMSGVSTTTSVLGSQNCQKLADFTLQQSLVLMTALTLLDFGRESTVTDETLKLVSSSAWP